MRNKQKTLAAITVLLLAGCAGADKPTDHFPGYASDRQGQLLRDRDGHCWRNADWRVDHALPDCDPSLAGPPQIAETAPEPEPAPESQAFQPVSITLPFASGQYQLDSNALRALENFLAQLPAEKLPQLLFRVEGHADPMGRAEDNRRLSTRRAQSVSDWLRQRGADDAAIAPSAQGESQADSNCPISLPRAEKIACLAPYRRVLVTVSWADEK
ncbi:OmpA family protein [Microbulbifer harenosus]|uniref:OmpA family protein n=1 Tax=Microbulbifer harenosus TaxID=2576840 RepID=A0ABY2UHD3_9GAMM|nr:OmpA family protein [Microbulbifer harenosus]TLM77065.1 OmpA family protein [Microbulbifer harenosus]